MTAYYNILETIKNQLVVDEFVNTVTQGDIFDVDLNKQTIFPLSHIMVNNVTRESNVLRFNVTVMCMDIVDKSKTETTDIFVGNDNEQDVLNTQLAVVSRMLEIFDRGGNVNTFRMDSDPNIEPFTERFENYLAGWSCTFDILVANDMTVCGPLITPAGCSPATINNSDSTYTASVASGGVLALPDSVINVNSVDVGDVVSVKTIDVNVTDGTDPVTPDAVSLVGNTLTIEVPSGGGGSVGATLMKTGQTTSYRTGDDGGLEAGRDTDFFTLPSNNPFGNTNRFTGTSGGYYDGGTSNFKDVAGVVTTYALAFPDDIMIDWSTFNGTTFLMYHIENNLLDGVVNLIATCTAATFGGFSTWRLWNVNEALNLFEWEAINYYGYEPLLSGNTTTIDFFVTSTAVNSGSCFQIRPATTTPISPINIGNSRRAYPVRTTNISELTI